MPKPDFDAMAEQIRQAVRADPEDARYAATISVWVRWLIGISSLLLIVYRPLFAYSTYIPYLFPLAVSVAVNAAVHYRLVTGRLVTWSWVLALSTMDVLVVTAAVIVGDGFPSFLFLAYYPALAMFAVVVTSIRINLAWTTMVAVLYAVVSLRVGPGLDFEARDDKELYARLLVMYTVVLCVSLVTRFERTRRMEAVERERALQRERIELSQTIHDTAAQTAYMIGLGIDTAVELADGSDEELSATLAATSALSKSAMLELRRPIDAGHIFEGRELGRVLQSHTATFTTITGVPVEMVQSGAEPPLATEARTRLFSIAHNALTNAFRHARASKVEVKLDFEADRVRLSVSDDGIGLPDDYAERGHGFGSMQADVERMGGWLIVEPGGGERGASVTCEIPSKRGGGGN